MQTNNAAIVIADQIGFWTKARLGVRGMVDMGKLDGARAALKLQLVGSKRIQMVISLDASDTYSIRTGQVGRGKRIGEWIEFGSVDGVYCDSLDRALEEQYMVAMRA